MNDIRYPKITGASSAAQLNQMKSYLHQLVDQLNMTLSGRVSGAEAAIKANADSIDLKVSKDGVISSINTSAEGVTINASKLAKITADRIMLEGYTTINDGFAVDKSGNVSANAGTIGGWTISDGKLKATGMAYLAPGQEEHDTIKSHLLGVETIPEESIPLYDYDGDGEISIADLVLFNSMRLGKVAMADWSGAVKTEVTIEIDPNNPDTPLHIYGTNMWGRMVHAYIGVDPSKSTFASREYLDSVVQMDASGGMYRTIDGETEWFNPPMELNTEYRTIERMAGSPVYVMVVDYGSLPNATKGTNYVLAAGMNIIDMRGFAVGTDHVIPIPGYSAITSLGYNQATGNLGIITSSDLSGYHGYITVKYTK